ncbi:hypothetical protein AGDE_01368 [Angomonas deanei]|uniref:Uncharacterized protein n=1 Tax=Angomonas deanei TaxID=59799 RepID=S9ULX1_9TRYP|nr:hypothetical protein AGDE_09694 [Angomonas deanei]EPY41983.1 hypothetical protein AGDE_01940 [Angomonas deanei]EPY42555.1 hypothetical protein AGDE_01368 [Angomonas deanei]CAD2213267.1 hypothetical protein, conserved [Angomonas deanei]|eukprot:EPY29938.1 hypothetical protein AGDE_09694 [Angomonas deanei]
MSFLESTLNFVLFYLTYVNPVVRGTRLCQQPNPNASQVSNVALTLIFAWWMEFLDAMFLSSFIAMRGLYTFVRIILLLYFIHPKFLGALRVYEKLFASLVDQYLPLVDKLVLQHVENIREWGLTRYATKTGMVLVRAVVDIIDIAQRLIVSSGDSHVKPARLQRRLSAERDDGEEPVVVPAPLPRAKATPVSRPLSPPPRVPTPPPRPQRSPPPAATVDSSIIFSSEADELSGPDTASDTPVATIRRDRGLNHTPTPKYSRHSSQSSFTH